MQRSVGRGEVDHHVGRLRKRLFDARRNGHFQRARAGEQPGVEADLRAVRLFERAGDDEIVVGAQRIEDARAHLSAHSGDAGADQSSQNRPPYARIAASTFTPPPSETGTSGSRHSGPMRPILCKACLTGSGLVSRNIAFTSGAKRICAFLATSWLPCAQASQSVARSAGAMLATTLITPCPPEARVGSVNMSSPARMEKSAGTPSERISATRTTLPLASFTPTIPGTFAQRATVSGSMSTEVREGTL